MPAGWQVRICVHECHRDPAVFADPDAFNPDRFAEHRYTRNQYAPFGLDSQACIGEQLTRALGRSMLRTLATYDWTASDDNVIGRHQSWHWTPSPRFAVNLSRRLAAFH